MDRCQAPPESCSTACTSDDARSLRRAFQVDSLHCPSGIAPGSTQRVAPSKSYASSRLKRRFYAAQPSSALTKRDVRSRVIRGTCVFLLRSCVGLGGQTIFFSGSRFTSNNRRRNGRPALIARDPSTLEVATSSPSCHKPFCMGNSEGDVVPAFRQSRSVLDAALQGLELGFAPTLGENGRSWFVGRHE